MFIHCSDVKSSRTSWPRGHKILSSASESKNCPRPQAFAISMSSNILFWPRENECNEFALMLSTYLCCVTDINLQFKFTFMVVFNYLGVFCNMIGYLWTRKIVLCLNGLSLFNITDSLCNYESTHLYSVIARLDDDVLL